MKVVMVKYFFDTESNYQVTEMAKAWPDEHELIIISTKYLDYIHKEFDEEQIKRDKAFESKYGVTIVRLDCWFRLGSRVFFKGLKTAVDKFSPDVLFMHGIGDFNDLLYLYGKNKYLTFRDCHMSWVASKNRFAKVYYKFFSLFFAPLINIFRKYETVYALGIEEKEYLEAIGIRDSAIAMLPHGYNKNAYYISSGIREKYRSVLEVSDTDILVVYTGKFDYSKRPDLNLDVYQSFSLDYIQKNNLKFVFIGSKNEGYFNDVFMPKLKECKFKDRVLILPSVAADDLINIYNASDVCLWPKETTLSSIHAQACGSLVVMEKHISNQERVIDASLLFEIDDLTDASSKLLDAIVKVKNGVRADVSAFPEREYNSQVSDMIASWERILVEKNCEVRNRK